MSVVAAFDFDETLTVKDSVVPFLRRFTTNRRLALELLPHALRLLPIAVRRDRNRLRALATELVFAGRPIALVETEAANFGAELAQTGLRHDTTERLRWHLDHGHHVVIVSASYEQYVRVVAARLGGVEGRVEVLATRLEVIDGECTGRLEGANCRGPEKVERLRAWLDANDLRREDVLIHAYGDSRGDDAMLAWADHPHRVNTQLDSVAPTD